MYNNVELEAKDFIKYDSKKAIEDFILDIFDSDISDYRDIEVGETKSELDIPDEFWEEWGTAKKTSIDKLCKYITEYIALQPSSTGNYINYHCDKDELKSIIQLLYNIDIVSISGCEISLGDNIINLTPKYDKE